jgi:hypothetical protein
MGQTMCKGCVTAAAAAAAVGAATGAVYVGPGTAADGCQVQ